jgi:hypothetical protein
MQLINKINRGRWKEENVVAEHNTVQNNKCTAIAESSTY